MSQAEVASVVAPVRLTPRECTDLTTEFINTKSKTEYGVIKNYSWTEDSSFVGKILDARIARIMAQRDLHLINNECIIITEDFHMNTEDDILIELMKGFGSVWFYKPCRKIPRIPENVLSLTISGNYNFQLDDLHSNLLDLNIKSNTIFRYSFDNLPSGILLLNFKESYIYHKINFFPDSLLSLEIGNYESARTGFFDREYFDLDNLPPSLIKFGSIGVFGKLTNIPPELISISIYLSEGQDESICQIEGTLPMTLKKYYNNNLMTAEEFNSIPDSVESITIMANLYEYTLKFPASLKSIEIELGGEIDIREIAPWVETVYIEYWILRKYAFDEIPLTIKNLYIVDYEIDCPEEEEDTTDEEIELWREELIEYLKAKGINAVKMVW